jgi:Family of unknown function (DUF6518)
VPLVAAVVLGLAFGGADQYLGSLSAHPWATQVSLLSAPWLLLAFAAGSTQREPLRGAVVGLGCTLAALAGYGATTLSPLENAHASRAAVLAFVASEARVIAGGVVTGPLFGWLGSRWRRDGRHAGAVGAVVVAVAVCCEPAAHAVAGGMRVLPAVRAGEVAAGAAILLVVAFRASVGRAAS